MKMWQVSESALLSVSVSLCLAVSLAQTVSADGFAVDEHDRSSGSLNVTEQGSPKARATETGSSPRDQSSANYPKAKRLLPGEEVVTPTGQRLKVWTTEGPVPVSPPPEPFEPRKGLDDIPVIVDIERDTKK